MMAAMSNCTAATHTHTHTRARARRGPRERAQHSVYWAWRARQLGRVGATQGTDAKQDDAKDDPIYGDDYGTGMTPIKTQEKG